MLKNSFIILITILVFLGCSPGGSSGTTLNSIVYTSSECTNTDILTTSHEITRPMLVVLVSYKDIQIDSSVSTWNSKIFGNSEGQLNNYYDEISNGKFAFTQATNCNGIASVYLDKNHPYADINTYVDDYYSQILPDLKLSLEALDDNISFDIYDTDGDGHITPDELLITFIIAGYEDAYEGHVAQGIWGHQSCVDSTNTPTLDGVTLMGCIDDGNYALFGEKHNKANPHDATIGIIAHELGHSAFNLPDLYNTSSSTGGIGVFGLMGAGTWTQKDANEYAGATPVHMTAWSKIYNNWITPEDVNDTNITQVLNATSLSSYNIIKIPINLNEYYLLENRYNSGYDRGFYILSDTFTGGMAIWHINEANLTPSRLLANNVNSDTNDKAVDLVEAASANIDSGGYGDEKNLFYSTNVTSFSGEDGNETNITSISVPGETMTLNVN